MPNHRNAASTDSADDSAAITAVVAASLRKDFRAFDLDRIGGVPVLVVQQGKLCVYASDGARVLKVIDPETEGGWDPSVAWPGAAPGGLLRVGQRVMSHLGNGRCLFEDGSGHFSNPQLLFAGEPVFAPIIGRGVNGLPALWTIVEDEGARMLLCCEGGLQPPPPPPTTANSAPIGVGTNAQRQAVALYLQSAGAQIDRVDVHTGTICAPLALLRPDGAPALGGGDLVTQVQEIEADGMAQLPLLIRARRAGSATDSVLIFDPASGHSNDVSLAVALGPAEAAWRSIGTATPMLEIYAVGADARLYHMRQLQHDLWLEPLAVAPSEFAGRRVVGVSVVNDRDGLVRALVTLAEADGTQVMFVVWQDPHRDDSAWQVRGVEVGSSALEAVQAYVSEVALADPIGLPLRATSVQLSADTPTDLRVNGRYLTVDAAGVSCVTDARGKLRLIDDTDTLGTPVLKLSHPELPADHVLVLDASAPTRARLLAAAGNDADGGKGLLNAQVPTEDGAKATPLLATAAQRASAADLAAAIRCTMSAARPAYATYGAAARLHAHSHATAACLVQLPHAAAPLGAIDASHMNGQGWVMHCHARQRLATRALRPGEFDRLRELASNRVDRGSTWSWADLFQSIRDGLQRVAQIALQVVDGAVHVLIEGAEWVWNGVVRFAHQLYDIVETVFDWVGIDIRPLFRWLGFVFSWSDILAMRDGLAVMLDQTLAFAAGLASYGASRVDPLAAQFKAGIGDAIGKLRPLGAKSIGERYKGRTDPAPDFSRASNQAQSDNVVGRALNEQLALPAACRRIRLIHPTTGLIVRDLSWPRAVPPDLEAAANSFAQQQSIVGLGNTIKDEALSGVGNECSLLDAALDKLLDALQAALQGAVDAGAAVAKALLAAVADALNGLRDLLNYKIDIPVVTPLVEKIIGAPCTLLNLVMLVVAIPTTIAYKVVCGVAPIGPTSADGSISLDDLRQRLDANHLLDVLGLRGQAAAKARAVAVLASGPAVPDKLLKFLLASAAVEQWFIAMDSDLADPSAPSAPSERDFLQAVESVVCDFIAWGVTAPWNTSKRFPAAFDWAIVPWGVSVGAIVVDIIAARATSRHSDYTAPLQVAYLASVLAQAGSYGLYMAKRPADDADPMIDAFTWVSYAVSILRFAKFIPLYRAYPPPAKLGVNVALAVLDTAGTALGTASSWLSILPSPKPASSQPPMGAHATIAHRAGLAHALSPSP